MICAETEDFFIIHENLKINLQPDSSTNTSSTLECHMLSLRKEYLMFNSIEVADQVTCQFYRKKRDPYVEKEVFHFEANSTVYISQRKEPQESCQKWKEQGHNEDGIYPIWVNGIQVNVSCDMTNFGGGWIVIQRRFDMSVDFYRSWEEYKEGFGEIDGGEFWLGNEYLHQLTRGNTDVEMIIEMEDANGEVKFGRFNNFMISDEGDFYRLNDTLQLVDGLEGFELMKGMQFSTYDMDRDTAATTNCAERFKGGWWMKSCVGCILNGMNGILSDFDTSYYGLRWNAWNGRKNKKRTKMMIKIY